MIKINYFKEDIYSGGIVSTPVDAIMSLKALKLISEDTKVIANFCKLNSNQN